MLNLIVALECEARPVIDRYRLARRSDCHAFPVFESTGRRLLISGSGKLAACAATTYAATLSGTESRCPAAFVNYGLAGHGSRPVGGGVYASSVRDAGSGRCWFPPQLCETGCPPGAVVSFDRPNDDYRLDGAFDMELAGICAGAQRFTSLEFIQAIKVVADNDPREQRALSARAGGELAESGLPALGLLVEHLEAAQAELAGDAYDAVSGLLDDRRLSAYQRNECEQLLRRLLACGRSRDELAALCAGSRNGRELVRALRGALSGADLILAP